MGFLSDLFWRRLARGLRKLRHHSPWEDFAGADWDERCLAVGSDHPLYAKQGRTITPWDLQQNGRTLAVFLKCHYRLPRWHGVMAALWPRGNWSPALQEWVNLEWAQAHGVPVPQPLAVGEIVRPWGKLQSFLAVENLVGMAALHEAIPMAQAALDPQTFRRWKRGLAIELARLSRLLHDQRRFHKDLYLCHFFIAEEDTRTPPADWAGRVRMIDLHRLSHHPLTWRWWQAKDLGQLLFSSIWPGVDDRDRAVFWRAYRGQKRRTWHVRWLERLIRFRARTYLKHEERAKGRSQEADPQLR